MFFIIQLTLTSAVLPGTLLKKYLEGDDLKIYVNKLDSSKTLVPYEYTFLKYCDTKSNEIDENLGQELSGDSLRESKYILKMNVNSTCNRLCKTVNLKDNDITNFLNFIDNDYKASWILDFLPAGEIKINPEEKCKKYNYNDGFPIGFKDNNTYYVFNHHNIEIFFHNESNKLTIVGFFVEPLNLKKKIQTSINSCKKSTNFNLKTNDECSPKYIGNEPLDDSIIFTYSISFIEKYTKWEERWKNYLEPSNASNLESTHLFSLVQSTVIAFILASIIASVLQRSVYRDISFYNNSFEDEPEIGWILVRSDVFRSPEYPSLFCIAIGTGTQLLTTIYITIIFALCNLFSAKHQGALLSGAFICYALMGIFAGYTSARFYKMFGGTAWQKNAIGTAIFLPGVCMTIFIFINCVLSADDSSGAVSFTNLLYLLFMWLIASLSLIYMGASIGSSQNVIENTYKVSRTPKPIQVTPDLNILRLVGFLAGGVLPFASVVIEMNYIMAALWHPEKFYNLFGFLFMCSINLVITSAEAAILLVSKLLTIEDYRWWWFSFFVPGSSGIYMFLYAVWYCFNRLALTGFSAYVIYFGYMLLICVGFTIATGTIGFYASYFFIRIIYSRLNRIS